MKHVKGNTGFRAVALAAALCAAAASVAVASGQPSASRLTVPQALDAVRPASVTEAETLNFFFDDIDGLLGAHVLGNDNRIAATVSELIVEQDGSISAMILTLPTAPLHSAMNDPLSLPAEAGLLDRRKAPTGDLMVVRAVSGEATVVIKDSVSGPREFPRFRPAPVWD